MEISPSAEGVANNIIRVSHEKNFRSSLSYIFFFFIPMAMFDGQYNNKITIIIIVIITTAVEIPQPRSDIRYNYIYYMYIVRFSGADDLTIYVFIFMQCSTH